MNRRLEKFVEDHREDFDAVEPGSAVWNNILQQLNKTPRQSRVLPGIKTLRWSAAAAILLLLGGGTWWLMNQKTSNITATTGNQQQHTRVAPAESPAGETGNTAKTDMPPEENRSVTPEKAAVAPTEDPSAEELYHYARLVELKQNQLKQLKKDEPLLYQQFAGDISKLDSSYHSLKQQLPANPNHEQILEAMIQNLQLQEALLNQQLNIIKKINHAKKTAYEKAYKSA